MHDTTRSGTPDMQASILHHLHYTVGKDAGHATVYDWRMALSHAIRDRIVDVWFSSTNRAYAAGAKRVYYLSMEFLIGRLLEDGLVNLRMLDAACEALDRFGLDPVAVIADEPDAALGNGGLGRLAACFLESMSSLGVPAHGYGIRYEHGLFQQRIVEGRQAELPETWLQEPHAWEFERPETRYRIGFGGQARDGAWEPGEAVIAAAYDTPVVGWNGVWANTLRLWSARSVRGFDLDSFNRGDFVGAAAPEETARTISRVLYPNDTTDIGKELRLKQEYFFTAASLSDILRRFEAEHGDLAKLPAKVAIQLNDTHPAIAGPELVRLLHDERGMGFEEAVATARATLGYTNHTLLPEALERWSEGLFGRLLPRHLELIDRIDQAHRAAYPGSSVRIHDAGTVNMGELSFVMAHKVNGVSALHTELMKKSVFAELNRLHPDRIVSQTNGVTPRRWLLSCNPRLAGLITARIGEGWVADLERLSELESHVDDPTFLESYAEAKQANKVDLANWIGARHGIALDPAMMFDVQIKRLHEYKRQHLNILEAVALWQAMRADPKADWTPRVKIFAGKAAPGYFFAKDIIRLINDVAEVVNADPLTRERLKVVFLPNYNVSLAERLIPASDLSEQISTAGKEASGTGNMKFALNGAPTIGTLDGANVEIREHVGAENFFLFGMTAEEAEARRKLPGHAQRAIAADPRLAAAIEAVRAGVFSPEEPGRYAHVADNIANHDYFLVASDFTDYWRAQREVDAVYRDRDAWTRMAAFNTVRSGWFSSDRTIRGYLKDIWGAAPLI
ncbi:glycogen/starch/alpha-glucan phosphorylase [Roseicyclus sp.]|uniref:glycogen/starch/alpha-glucan phosphorylase n=1 Tax=Roseicyclus sp. TaxID=1914329 RepID=UPI003FA17000